MNYKQGDFYIYRKDLAKPFENAPFEQVKLIYFRGLNVEIPKQTEIIIFQDDDGKEKILSENCYAKKLSHDIGKKYQRTSPVKSDDLVFTSFEIIDVSENSVKIQGLIDNILRAERKILLTDIDQFLIDFNQTTNDSH